MNEEISIREIKEMPTVPDTPFAMAIVNDKWEIMMYGAYNADLANEMPHIPLYTKPQTNPLSDEEIIAIRDSCYVQSGIDEWEFDDVNFARAIEERHGIK